jgi:hypothetical protein
MHVCGNPWHDVPMLAMFVLHQPDLFLPAVRSLWRRLTASGL